MPVTTAKTRRRQTACPVEAALQVIGGKWKPVILYHLVDGTKRFNELRRLMPGITQRMLTNQLRDLETDGIVDRKIYPQVPPKVEYSLTPHGETLIPVLSSLHDWGVSYALPVMADTTPATARPVTDKVDRITEAREQTGTETKEPLPVAPEPPSKQRRTVPRTGRPWGATGLGGL